MILRFENAVKKFPQLVPFFKQAEISSSNFVSVDERRLSLRRRPYRYVAKPHQHTWLHIWLIIQKGNQSVATPVPKTTNGWLTPECILEKMRISITRRHPVQNIVVVEKFSDSRIIYVLTIDRRCPNTTFMEYMEYIVEKRAAARKK